MRKPVYITLADAVTPLGRDLESTFCALKDGCSAIAPITRFDTDDFLSVYGALIPDLTTAPGTAQPPMIIQLADMLISRLPAIDPDTFLIVASAKAAIDTLDDAIAQSRIIPDNLLMSCLTDYIRSKLGLLQEGININNACASGSVALAKGAALIASGTCESVLVCCLDTVSRFVFSGFSAIGAMSPEPAMPFDENRSGLSLGEGGSIMMLMSKNRARKSGLNMLACLRGWGIAGDAASLTAPARDGVGLKLAVKAACRTAGISARDIPGISAHGTGTRYNDAMELQVLNELFDPATVTANSIKGAIGHSLGSSGGIEASLCLKMMETGIILPTTGVQNPDKKAGRMVSPEARTLPAPRMMTMNSGFGGINAALILERV